MSDHDDSPTTTTSTEVPQPTTQDHENERRRLEIAEKQEAEYLECLSWAIAAFGLGWEPRCRHFLLDKDDEERCRRTGEKPTPAATVYTVANAEGWKRHFTVNEGREVIECASMEAGFGDKLLEPHPTRSIEVRGQLIAPHHYSLCFATYDLYRPMSAERLAKLRATRTRNKKDREDKKWAEDHPLFALSGLRREDFEEGQPH